MRSQFTRRTALKLAALGLVPAWPARVRAALAEGESETYGLSAFGDLALPADFKHYDYVNRRAEGRPAVAANHQHGRQPEF